MSDAQQKLDALVKAMDEKIGGTVVTRRMWEDAKREAGIRPSVDDLPFGVYFPYKGSDDYGTPNVWLHMPSGWIGLPNVIGYETYRVDRQKIERAILDGELVYLGLGTDDQVVRR